jgi:anti-sigma-K factor RskA
MSPVENVHEMLAPYALDALDADERRTFERHLEECAECREELPSLGDTAAALALGVLPVNPPPELRGRILAEARKGGTVVKFPRRATPMLGAVAAVAACAAIGLGVWAATLHGSLSRERSAKARENAALAILADPAARKVPLTGRRGVLAVSPDGTAALAISSLGRAPAGKTYEAWVIRAQTPTPAGVFGGENDRATLVALRQRVPAGAGVAVTVEKAGGVARPTSAPIARAST